jgi:hypothetical protein
MDVDQPPDLIPPFQKAVSDLIACPRDAALPAAAVEALQAAVGALNAARPALPQEAAQTVWATSCELWVGGGRVYVGSLRGICSMRILIAAPDAH